MKGVTAAWIAKAVEGELAANPTQEVSAVVRDSREVRPGALYVALPGERADGHEFVSAATTAGAVLHLVTRPVDAPHILVKDASVALGSLAREYLAMLRATCSIKVIGITGSVGKTTTKDLLAQMLPDCVSPEGSYNNEIGVPLTVLRADEATRNLVVEMGASGVGHISYLTAIAPLDIAVVLAVGTAHLGEYASIDEVAKAKAEILGGLKPEGIAILNADDQRVAAMASVTRNVITFGTRAGLVRASDVRTSGGRAEFTVTDGGVSARVALSLIGEHHVTNALAAFAVARASGMSPADAAARVSAARALSPHRMALTERPDGVTILDDSYNASPEAMSAAFHALREIAGGGRSIAVIGEMLEMGDASLKAHEEVGRLYVRLGIDRMLVVGEGAKAAYDAAVREGSFGDEVAYVVTIDEAREYLNAILQAGDTVLIKASHGSGLWNLADQLVGSDA